MKREWRTLTGMCTVVIGIVVFCVLMGGYTSLLRAKNRINAAKGIMAEECRKQINRVNDLVSLAQDTVPPELIDRIEKNTKALPAVLTDLTTSDDPLSPHLLAAFETLAANIAKDGAELAEAVKAPNERLTAYRDQALATAYIAKRYNKEARYFNHRKTVFPGVLVAKLFNLESLHFPEITLSVFEAGTDTARS